MSKQAKLHDVFQARVTPKLKWPHQKLVLNYDSQLVFPSFDLAEKFVPYYVRQLIEIGVLNINQKYDAGVIQLSVFDGAVDINGVEAAS